MTNIGIQLEYEFIKFLNNRRAGNFNDKWKRHLKRMFPNIKPTDIVYAYKYGDPNAKPDIVIKVAGVTKLISIKSGRNPSMHMEFFVYFWDFMTKMGISEETKQIVSLYQFGTSKYFKVYGTPLTKKEIVERFGNLILKANKELNQERVIKNIAYRSIIRGANKERELVDFLYFGNPAKGYLVSRDQIYESVTSRKDLSSDYIHFGELIYQPSGRSRKGKDWRYARIHWPMLSRLYYECLDDDNIMKRKSPQEWLNSPEYKKQNVTPRVVIKNVVKPEELKLNKPHKKLTWYQKVWKWLLEN